MYECTGGWAIVSYLIKTLGKKNKKHNVKRQSSLFLFFFNKVGYKSEMTKVQKDSLKTRQAKLEVMCIFKINIMLPYK